MRRRWKEQSLQRVVPGTASIGANDGFSDVPDTKSELLSLPSEPIDGGEISSDEVADEWDEPSNKRPRVNVVDEIGDSSDVLQVANASASSTTNRLFSSAVRNTDLGQFKFPWEKGPLASFFSKQSDNLIPLPKLQPGFNNAVSLDLKVTEESRVEPRLSAASSRPMGAIYESVVKQTDSEDFSAQRVQQKQLALSSWWKLLASNISASAFGQKVLEEASRDSVNAYAIEILDATFAVKSPNTLMKRYYALKGYFDFCENVEGCEWAPLTELSAWKYAKYLRDSDASATKIGSFIEAARFAWYMLGLHGANHVEASLRVKGLSAQMRVKKKPWRPAALLTITEVSSLHAGLENESLDVTDRIFCGHMLHLLYSRSRWSDLLAVVDAYMDEDKAFFELCTQQHKGAKCAETKAKLLPIVAPCKGITGKDWVEPYMKLRTLAGLPLPSSDPLAMLPAPKGSTGHLWRKRHLTSEEGAGFLRNYLNAPKTESRRVSTHSMKATAISWCAKAGLSEESRALLARHASAVKNPVALYSRDLLSAVLREFSEVLDKITMKTFEPDRSRSGMMTPSRAAPPNPATPFLSPSLEESMRVAAPKAKPSPEKFGEFDGLPEEMEMPNMNEVTTEGQAEPLPLESLDLEQLDSGVDQVPTPWASTRLFGEMSEQLFDEDINMSEIFTDSSEDLSEESSSYEEDEVDLETERKRNTLLPRLESVSGLFINSKSAVVHCKKTATAFVCGRKISDNYVAIHEPSGLRCGRCFNI